VALDDQSLGEVRAKAELAKKASRAVARLSAKKRNDILMAQADALLTAQEQILAANARDVARAKEKGATAAFIDRLTLSEQRVHDMAAGLAQVADLPDPLGVALRKWRLPNGLDIAQVRVPLGVVAVIYEGRPNVTVDVAGLCIKSGNATVLRGSSDAIESNKALVEALTHAGEAAGSPRGAIQLIHSVTQQQKGGPQSRRPQQSWYDIHAESLAEPAEPRWTLRARARYLRSTGNRDARSPQCPV
jgi:glutamate-5-semialdehyde dehydrogenase